MDHTIQSSDDFGLAGVAARPCRTANRGWTSTRREAITMSTTPAKSVLITGANAGIGKEVARQLALRPEIARIYLASRNRDRATAAQAELEAATGRRIFDIVLTDVANLDSVRAGLSAID